MLFVHENNLLNKIRSDYNGIGNKIKSFYETEYLNYKKKLLKIDFSSKNIDEYKKATTLVDEYIGKIEKFGEENRITSQSKFRSTFIEELSCYLFKNLDLIKKENLGVYNKGIFAGMKINNHMQIDVIKKDVDFCIGKKIELKIDSQEPINLIIPIVSVEVKTYLDATMFGEVQHSSTQIKNASPNSKTYVLMEYNDVSSEKIIASRYSNVLNEMFVLRGGSRKEKFLSPMSPEVLLEYYKEIETAVDTSSFEDTVIVPGKLINPD